MPHQINDLAVYGRYAAIEHASGDLIYVQDDDVIVSDPERIVRTWSTAQRECQEGSWDPQKLWIGAPNPGDLAGISAGNHVVCNMPPEFRHDFYREHALVGFGAVFHRDAPERAFERFWNASDDLGTLSKETLRAGALFQRTCDVVFTALTPRVLVDVPIRHLPWYDAPTRMHKQPDHVGERARMLELALRVRDGD